MHDTRADTLYALEKLGWGLQGLAILADPAAVLAAEDRGHLSILLEIVAESSDEIVAESSSELVAESSDELRVSAIQAVARMADCDQLLSSADRGDLACLLALFADRLGKLVCALGNKHE